MGIRTGADYIESLRGRNLKVRILGEWVDEPVDHPMVRPSINAVAETYDLAVREEELATAESKLAGKRVNRFLHIAESAQDLVRQNLMQRKLGQNTGTCFQRCVGMDALNALHSVTYEIDEKHNTNYHKRFLDFVRMVQETNEVIGGAMTDTKGDRSKTPSEQADPDMYTHVVDADEKGIYVTGAKAHQTGCINSHWIIIMPTIRLAEDDRDYAIVGAFRADAPGIIYVYGRQSCDTRSMEGGDIDVGNEQYGGQEATLIMDRVFIPWEYVFMHGEWEFASMLVERFTCYHRRSYVCKTGVGDVLIGAAGVIADYNGVPKVSHIRDKLVEMNHLNETIFGCGTSSSFLAHPMKSGVYLNDDMLAQVCKHNVTRFPYEIARRAQDVAGGLLVTLPAEQDFKDPEIGKLLRKYFVGRKGVDVESRARILRLIENMTMGRNAVGYLTESMHGAGSPQAQRIQIQRQMQLGYKKNLAKKLAGIDDTEEPHENSEYFRRIFGITNGK